jgi:hypothetical protein
MLILGIGKDFLTILWFNSQKFLRKQADRACGSSAHGQTDCQLFSVLYSLMMKYVSMFVHIVM